MKAIQHHILHAEDDPNDVLLVQLALRKFSPDCTVSCVEDGAEAIAYLKRENAYSNRELHPLPTLVLLDIKIPRYSGLEVLEWIRSKGQFTSTPVLMFTSSHNIADVRRAYELGANGYMLKAVEYRDLEDTIRSAMDFWLKRNLLPI